MTSEFAHRLPSLAPPRPRMSGPEHVMGWAASHPRRRRVNPVTGEPILGEYVRIATSPSGPGWLEILTVEEMAAVEPGTDSRDFAYFPRARVYLRGGFEDSRQPQAGARS